MLLCIIMKLLRLKLYSLILSSCKEAANSTFFLWDFGHLLVTQEHSPLLYLIFSQESLEVLPKAPTFKLWIIKTDNVLEAEVILVHWELHL